MKICVFYTSPKLGDIILQLPFIKAISDHYKTKVIVCVNKHVNIKDILVKQEYVSLVIENPFRKGKFYLKDFFNLYKEIKKEKINFAYILDKTKAPAIACKLAKIDKIFGFGIGSQKYFVDQSCRLGKDDLRYNYTLQSIIFLKKLGISFNFEDKYLVLDKNYKLDILNKNQNLDKPWVCFAVDSTEVNRIWPQKSFAELGDILIKKKLAKYIFVVNYENHLNYFDEIIKNSNYKNHFINCKSLNRSQIIYLINACDYFVGIDSGPSCVAGALNKNTFCIIGPTDATLPRFNSMKKIVSNIYDKSREVGIKRCGDNFAQDDTEVKTISVSKVFDTIVKNL